MNNAKKQSVDMIQNLPEDSELEDILYSLYLQYKIALSLNDMANGDVISLEDLRKEVETR